MTKKALTWTRNEKGCYIVTSHVCNNVKAGGHLRYKPNGKTVSIHRFLYEYIYGKVSKNLVIRHKCDTPKCINLNHLIVGTQADNVKDMYERKREFHPRGSLNSKSKLTEDQVRCIRTISYIFPRKELQEMFKISKAMLAKILNRSHWSHI